MSYTDERVPYLEFINGILYDSIGPASGVILKSAQQEWVKQGNKIPEQYED